MFWTGGTSYLSTQHGVMRFGIEGDHAASGSYLPSEVGRKGRRFLSLGGTGLDLRFGGEVLRGVTEVEVKEGDHARF
jgi:hypothetical protein